MVISVEVKIGTVAAPRGIGLAVDDLRARVRAELADLLAREPLRTQLRDGTMLAVPGGPLQVSSLASPAEVAHTIARHVLATLQVPEPPA